MASDPSGKAAGRRTSPYHKRPRGGENQLVVDKCGVKPDSGNPPPRINKYRRWSADAMLPTSFDADSSSIGRLIEKLRIGQALLERRIGKTDHDFALRIPVHY